MKSALGLLGLVAATGSAAALGLALELPLTLQGAVIIGAAALYVGLLSWLGAELHARQPPPLDDPPTHPTYWHRLPSGTDVKVVVLGPDPSRDGWVVVQSVEPQRPGMDVAERAALRPTGVSMRPLRHQRRAPDTR